MKKRLEVFCEVFEGKRLSFSGLGEMFRRLKDKKLDLGSWWLVLLFGFYGEWFFGISVERVG